jgi:hypothetical protein
MTIPAKKKQTLNKAAHQVGTPAVEEPSDDFNGLEEVAPVSVLEAFKRSLKEESEAAVEPYRLTVPLRPSMTLVFNTVIDYDTYQAWITKCTDRKTKEVNYWHLAVVVISNTNIGVEYNNEEVPGFTVLSHELHGWLNVPIGSVASAIRELYKKKDGHAIQAMRMIVEDAGYTMDGDVTEAEDSPLDV